MNESRLIDSWIAELGLAGRAGRARTRAALPADAEVSAVGYGQTVPTRRLRLMPAAHPESRTERARGEAFRPCLGGA
jgi:hypothetical protein